MRDTGLKGAAAIAEAGADPVFVEPGTLGEAFPMTWRLPERVDIVEFCEKHRRLSARSSSSPGAYSLDRFPYWREVLAAFTDPAVRWLTIVAGSQTGKTTVCENFLFYVVVVDPTPAMWVFASESLRNEFVAERLKPAIDASPEWKRHVAIGQWAVSNTMTSFTTMPLFYGLADSEASLSSKPVGFVICDETGKYPANTTNEGSPIDQARARMRTFPRGKFVDTSTPTDATSGIWPSYLQSDMREWKVPCPACGVFHAWDRELIRWDERPAGVSFLEWASRIAANPDMAWWQCPSCGHQARGQLAKNLMNLAGKFEGRGYPTDHAGFHVPSLASPYTSFAEYAAGLLKALGAREGGDEQPLKHWTLHEDARPWSPKRVVIEEESIARLAREDMPQGRVPDGTRLLTCGVDVQDAGLYFQVWAWRNAADGDGVAGHMVDHGFVPDFATLEREVLGRHYLLANGQGRVVDMLFIDSGDGDATADVYRWTNRKSPRRVRPIKGASTKGGGRFYRESKGGEDNDHRGRLVIVYPDEVKHYLAKAMVRGRVSFHEGVKADPDFQSQMTSEEFGEVKSGRGAKKRAAWRLRDGRRKNHHWDCAVYGHAAAFFCGLARNDGRWRKRMGAVPVQVPVERPAEDGQANDVTVAVEQRASEPATTTKPAAPRRALVRRAYRDAGW